MNKALRKKILLGLFCTTLASGSLFSGNVCAADDGKSTITAEQTSEENQNPNAFTARIQKLLDNYHKERENILHGHNRELVRPAEEAAADPAFVTADTQEAEEKAASDFPKRITLPASPPAVSETVPEQLAVGKYDFDWQGTPIAQSLYAVAKIAERDVVVNGSLAGNVYMSLHGVTCEQAMDYLSRAFNFNWSADDNAILISTADLMKPSEIFQVHYANKDKLKEELKSLGIDEKNIYANMESGTISVTGTPYQLREAGKRIKAIDIPVSQCLLVAQMVELSHGDNLNLGMQYTLPTYSHTAENSDSSASSFFGGSVIDKLTFSASSSASKALSKGRVIARPMVMMLNGQKGIVSFGDKVPILKTTTSTSSTDITVEYRDVGTKLEVIPIIDTSTNEISMTINTEISNISKWVTLGQTTAPQIASRQATTSAHLKSGQSFVIGGLMSVNELDNLSGIPGLMNLPILGKLFSYHSKSKTYAEVYIMITPYIVTDNMDPKSLLNKVGGENLGR